MEWKGKMEQREKMEQSSVKMGPVSVRMTDDRICIYWEIPDCFMEGDCYRIFLDGKMTGQTDRTHWEFEDLPSETSFDARVEWMRGETVLFSQTLSVETKKNKKILDITKAPYSAVGDGRTMNTEAIQSAIDDCTEEYCVYIPEGIFLTGSLTLHSNMEIYLAEGAVLQGTDRAEDYLPKIPSRFEGQEMMCYSSLLNMGSLDHANGPNCENVVVRGRGTVAGGGRVLAERVIALETENLKDYLEALGEKIRECEKPETIPGRSRPRLINISNCRNVYLSGITIKDGASWNVHMIYSDNIVTENCIFRSKDVWNGDGWDPDSSENCTIFGCTFYTGDDGIAIKSGKNPEGNVIGRPSRHIRVFDCKSESGHGITIGSEMSGGVEDVMIWDCDMTRSRCGIEIKGTKKRGGYVRNIVVRNCRTPRILMHSVSYNDDGIGAGVQPVFENCRFSGIQITGEYIGDEDALILCNPVELSGFDEPGHELRNIVFEDLTLGKKECVRKQSISLEYCENVSLVNVQTAR